MNLLEVDLPILEQLKLEEALLRVDDRPWLILNKGSTPAVVMGISGKVEELDPVHLHKCSLPVIRRYSGGGTVVVDHNTLFVSLIGHKKMLNFPCFPERLMRWTGDLYRDAFGIDQFAMRENDYVIGDLKCGGNAQYLRKERWLHHTTFLWDFDADKMKALKLPSKQPAYRQNRDHTEFLTHLSSHFSSPDAVFEAIKHQVNQLFSLKPVALDDVISILDQDHRRSTTLLA